MVYANKKFQYYFLGNKFVFYVDHMAMIYLVNKTDVSGGVVQWLLLYLKFDFTVVYKPSKTHGIADALHWTPTDEPAHGIHDATTNIHLLNNRQP